MKKIFLALLLTPLMFGLGSKNTVKTETFTAKSPSFVLIRSSNDAQGFLEYWLIFREENPEVCDITKDAYKEMYAHYSLLSQEDKEYVNAQPDVEEGYTIGAIIRTLVNKYYPNQNKMNEDKQKLDQSSIIVIATVVALVGATAISVLYILKNQKVIK